MNTKITLDTYLYTFMRLLVGNIFAYNLGGKFSLTSNRHVYGRICWNYFTCKDNVGFV